MCREYDYDASGQIKQMIEVTPEGEILTPKRRIPGAKLPCETRVGCPKGHWSKPRGFDQLSREVYEQFTECRMVGEFPTDALFRQLATIIDSTERTCDRAEARRNALLIAKASIARLP